MGAALFGRIARHPLRVGLNEAENRLTEIFAAVLVHRECDGLAVLQACDWLQQAVEQDGMAGQEALRRALELLSADGAQLRRVNTQIFTAVAGRKRRPDLELVFETGGGRELRFWIEVKHGSRPHSRQLHDYVEAQRQRGIAYGAVLLLAPRADLAGFDPDEIPASVPRLTWQRTAVALARSRPANPIGQFLVAELEAYLQEERLMDPDRLTPERGEVTECRLVRERVAPLRKEVLQPVDCRVIAFDRCCLAQV